MHCGRGAMGKNDWVYLEEGGAHIVLKYAGCDEELVLMIKT